MLSLAGEQLCLRCHVYPGSMSMSIMSIIIIYSEVPPVPTARTPLIRLSVSGLSFRLWSVVLTPLLS